MDEAPASFTVNGEITATVRSPTGLGSRDAKASANTAVQPNNVSNKQLIWLMLSAK